MNFEHQNTGVVLFTRLASEEARLKDFGEHRAVNAIIADKMIAHATQTIRKSGLPYFIVDSSQQQGKNFGERFSHALEQVFSSGIDHILVIGNDCLSLTANDLVIAADQIHHHNYVIGPSADGGIYLFGINKSVFDKNWLSGLPWESPVLFDSFINYLQEHALTYYLTDVKRDIDSAEDIVHAFYVKDISFELIRFIRSILASSNHFRVNCKHIILLAFASRLALLRAPPY